MSAISPFMEMFSMITQLSAFSCFGAAGYQAFKKWRGIEEKHEAESKLEKVMENAKMYEKDSEGNMHYPRIRKIDDSKEYGYDMTYTIPYGQDVSEWEKNKGKIETALESEVEIEADGRKLTLKVLANQLKDEYTYQEDILEYLAGKLTVPIGYTKKSFLTLDIADKQMHTLIAGYSGAGKSVTIRQMLTSLILKYPVGYLNLHLIDLKIVELSTFKNTPYCESYSTTHEDTLDTLLELQNEMEYRYNVINQEPNAKSINDLGGNMPYEVVVVDEYAELSPNALTGEE